MTTLPQRKSGRFIGRLEQAASGLVVAWAVFAPGSAQAETRAWIGTSAKAEIATNPYLLSGPKTSASSAILSVSPGLKFVDSVKTISLRADFVHTEFSRRYRSSDNYNASASLSQKISPRLGLNASFGYDSSVVGANDLLTFGTNPLPGVIPPPLPGDIALNGLRQRREAVNGGFSLDYAASTRDNLQVQGGFAIVRFPAGSGAAEYDSSNGSIGYNRVLNSRTSVGLNVGVSRADYLGATLGDATTISPQATFSTKFGANWSLSASLGVSHSRISGLVGKSGQNSASGNLSLCNAASRGKFCLFGSRSVQPTSFGNTVRPQTSVGLSYNMRLDPLSTIDASASLSRSGQISQNNIITGSSVDYGRASMTYSRRISQKLQGYVTASYADSYRDPTPRKANSSVSLGISYSFGDTR